jgi:hypothetical protein
MDIEHPSAQPGRQRYPYPITGGAGGMNWSQIHQLGRALNPAVGRKTRLNRQLRETAFTSALRQHFIYRHVDSSGLYRGNIYHYFG